MAYHISDFPDPKTSCFKLDHKLVQFVVFFLFTVNPMLQRPLVENRMMTVSARKVIQTILITVMILIKKFASFVSKIKKINFLSQSCDYFLIHNFNICFGCSKEPSQ